MGDSLGQVASQTLRNLVAVDAASSMTVFRPLAGADKMEILATARKIGTYAISSEPFHDCCPVFLPRNPALRASAEDLAEAEEKLDVAALVVQGVRGAMLISFEYKGGEITEVETPIRRALAQERRLSRRVASFAPTNFLRTEPAKRQRNETRNGRARCRARRD